MPCFLVGIGAAQMLAQALGVPLRRFSHQQGHIAAALYSVNRLDLLHERFLAFHMSGGTTEAVLVEPVEGDKMFRTRLVASSLDLKAGPVSYTHLFPLQICSAHSLALRGGKIRKFKQNMHDIFRAVCYNILE